LKRRLEQIEESVAPYPRQLDSADRQAPSLARPTKQERLTDEIAEPKEETRRLTELKARMPAAPDQQLSLIGEARLGLGFR